MGDEEFKAHRYLSAIEFYNKILENSPDDVHANYMLAESYRLSFKYDLAEQKYKKVKEINSVDYPLALFYLAVTEKMNNKYQEAIGTFDEFIKYARQNEFTDKGTFLLQAKIEKEGCGLAIERSSLPFKSYKLNQLPAPVNSEFNDYAAFPFNNDSSIAITSSRKKSVELAKESVSGEEFTDCLRFQKNQEGWVPYKSDDDFEKINGESNEGAGVYANNFTKYYFTKCSGSDCNIFVTTFSNGKWQPEIKLNDNINQKNTESKHPALSVSGDTLFFISNRPGGYGMNDVYYSLSKGDDQWGQAKNLGKIVNTPFNEVSPFYFSTEKILIIASQGHPGYGGFDFFIVRDPFSGQGVENMGKPFNSEMDDICFMTGRSRGYLSSNRPGGKGNFDIYSFDIYSDNSIIASLEKNEDKNDTTVLAANPQAVSTNNKTVDNKIVDNKAANNNTADDKTVAYTASNDKKSKEVGQINTFNTNGAKSLSISGNLYDFGSGRPLEGVEVALVNERGVELTVTTSNKDGFFRYTEIPTDQRYRVIVKSRATSVYNLEKISVKGLKVESFTGLASISKFENIYFDFDQFKLRPEATKTLDELSELCKSNPSVQIEIDSYADFVGNDEYNEKLSKKRGATAFQYLLKKGVDRSSLVVIAKGEKNPVASNQTLTGRQLNRRIEFKIKGLDAQPVASTYIIEPKMTLYSIAKKYSVSIDDLRKANGLINNNIMAYRPLRIPINNLNAKTLADEIVTLNSNAPARSNAPQTYRVKHGDTVFSIAVKFNMTVQRLFELNNIENGLIKSGQRLKIESRP
ncbi:hypothetical protein WSM22_47720 [Cytophagales bacterium WSM2-2]|nr:hypothetical protein WSM22_47720 [Cytophagales bacterium WSM2-2]